MIVLLNYEGSWTDLIRDIPQGLGAAAMIYGIFSGTIIESAFWLLSLIHSANINAMFDRAPTGRRTSWQDATGPCRSLRIRCPQAIPTHRRILTPRSGDHQTVGWQSARPGDEATFKQGPSFDGPGFTPAEAIAMTEHMRRKQASRFLGDTTLFFDQRVTVCVPHTLLPIEPGWGSFDLEIAGPMTNCGLNRDGEDNVMTGDKCRLGAGCVNGASPVLGGVGDSIGKGSNIVTPQGRNP